MLNKQRIAFIGAGSMAEAMISGFVNSEKVPADQIIVTNRNNQERLQELENKYGIKTSKREDIQFDHVDILILAMKPKDADIALQSIKEYIKPHQLVLSVLAGISTFFMEQNLQAGQAVIRVMPNTSSMIGESATALSPGQFTTKQQVAIAAELLKTIGEAYIIEEEKMDIFTGIAGSGPAYFYFLMEHMEQEGLTGGLDAETTRQIIAQTIAGAAKMIQSQNETPTVLRENVTSPNGTTEAGLKALESKGGGKAIAEAIKHAATRSKEISSQLEENLVNQKVEKAKVMV
ncbi:pyrroline-5-carboxylate reductase [Peribacillus cavernae]|uniref:Pyrroline-5-carboxylate reductase n=1 Tax=Peribacillus cavernae TaxID=1674310 RepID=A0A433HBR0_9BACI|nr:pyrroline-5-carboxylate reductase [Peribacillus cavernae]MDQ0220366.1 pyrroline-5-carboxylate reductase [Peribacillus cavernae]RUQ25545.1 pyrroline-5-carboxylate reductase [Peribacillus cavernae]